MTANGKSPILVIEDEPAVMAFIQSALERSGYRVAPASSGADALPMLASGDFHCVISDMRTPGGVNGADVHAYISGHRPDLLGRMLFITGDIVNEETARVLRKTGVPCIEKPFRVQQLISAVEQLCGAAQ
jgi:CheY-like chemotaxis protein